jgi:glycosyltransferase involved in cell wall biosynthesis
VASVRVLWLCGGLTGTARLALGFAPVEGPMAWIDALAAVAAAAPELELHVAGPAPRPAQSSEYDGVTYPALPPTDAWGWPAVLPGRDRAGRACARSLDAASRLASSLAVDLIHVHGTENPYGLLAGRGDPPVVISLQGILTECQRHYFDGFGPDDLVRAMFSRASLRGSGAIQGYWRMRAMARREESIARHAPVFLGRTQWDRDHVERVDPRVRYFVVDELLRRPFHEAAWGEGRGDGTVIFTTSGSMVFKGTETAVAALAAIAPSYSDVELRVAGVPPGSEADTLFRRAAHRHGVSARVTWLGPLDAGRLARELSACDVYLYPSHIDNSPNALCEALLVGAPCVASSAGGIPSLIDDGRTGLLVPPGDAGAMARAAMQVLGDRELAARIGRAARTCMQVRHDPERVRDQLLSAYRSVLQ